MDNFNVIIPADDGLLFDEDRVWGKTHRLDDQLLLARLQPWLFVEYMHTIYWLCVLRSNGEFKYWGSHSEDDPPEDKRFYCRSILESLNRYHNCGGAWVGGWVHIGWKEMFFVWKDEDGDIQVAISTEGQSWPEIQKSTTDNWRQRAMAAHEMWERKIAFERKDLGLGTIMRAKGEKPPEDQLRNWIDTHRDLA